MAAKTLFSLWAFVHAVSSLPASPVRIVSEPSPTIVEPIDRTPYPGLQEDSSLPNWQKDGKTAQWAPGYPKTWGSEVLKYREPEELNLTGLWLSPVVTSNERFIILSDRSEIRIVELANNKVITTITQPASDMDVVDAKDGGFWLLTSLEGPNEDGFYEYSSTVFHLSPEAVPSEPLARNGSIPAFRPRVNVQDGRYFTFDGNWKAYIYSLEDPQYQLILEGHLDDVLDADWSPDGEHIVSTGFDATLKLWNAQTGEFLQDIDADFQSSPNWIVRYSPDGKYIALTAGAYLAKIYDTKDFSAPPVVIEGFPWWVRSVEWSPDSKLVVFGGVGQIQVYSVEERKTVQTWQQPTVVGGEEVAEVRWLGNGTKLLYRVNAGTEVYDFDTNLKYRWGPNKGDVNRLGGTSRATPILEKKGWIGSQDSDFAIRFYELPETLL